MDFIYKTPLLGLAMSPQPHIQLIVPRPSSKGTKVLLQVIKAIINQFMCVCVCERESVCVFLAL